MVVRIVLVGAVLAAALSFVRQQDVLQNAGLIGYCSRVVTPAGQDGVWHECHSGTITGTPELSLKSCSRVLHNEDRDLWRCETELESNDVRG